MALTATQTEARRRGVGSSELLAALGKDARCTRLELYKRKLGELPELDFSDDERVRFGNLLEPVIRKEVSRRMGVKVVQPRQTLFHPTAPLLGHPDGWMPKLREGVEIKTADKHEAAEFGEEESDQVPIRYLVQCAGYMALTGAERWHLAVLIGGNDLRMYEIPRDAELEEAILVGAREFWSHIETGSPPDPATPEDVKLRWPKDLGTTVIATADIAAACSGLKELKSDLKSLTERVEREAADIKNFMAEGAQLVDADGTLLATWRKAKDSRAFDETAFARIHPQLHQQFMRDVTGSRRFLLK